MKKYEVPEIKVVRILSDEILGESSPWTELPEDGFDEN